MGFSIPAASGVKNLPVKTGGIEMQFPSLRWEDSLEETVATHCSITG